MNPPPRTLRPLPVPADELPAGQRRMLVAGILVLHGVAGWAVLQVPAVRETLSDVAPVFVSWIVPSAAPEQPVLPLPPPPPIRPPIKTQPPPLPLLSAAPSPAPAPFSVAPPLELPESPAPIALPVVTAAPVAVAAGVPASAPPPALPAPAPKTIPASAVQYLEPPLPEYPRLSRRARESGRVLVRVYIDEAGLPRTVQLSQSSGHARLDDAAVAAVQKARFKPYTEDGRPTPGWAFIPLDFDLEK